METWKTISGFSRYEVSTKGQIRVKKSGHIMQSADNGHGYWAISLVGDSGKRRRVYVHRLVAQAFIENKENLLTVDHIDTIRNNNNVENLRWLSHADNSRRSFYEASKPRGGCRLSPNDVLMIIDITKVITNYEAIAKHFKVSVSTIRSILNGSTWSPITGIGREVA